MVNPVALRIEGETAWVEGELDFDNVVALAREGEQWLRHTAPDHCQLNLSRLTRSNSAGTALLLDWLRVAASVNKQLQITQVPEMLRSLMDLGGIEDLLPTRSTSTDQAD